MRSDLPRSRTARRWLAISLVGTRSTRSPARSGTARRSPTHAGSPQAPRRAPGQSHAPTQQLAIARAADCCGLVAEQLARRRNDRRDRVVRLCMSAPSTIIRPVHLHLELSGPRRTRLAAGAATLLSSHAGHPRSATSDKAKVVRPCGRQPQRESARRRSGTLTFSVGRHRRGPSQQQASKEQWRLPREWPTDGRRQSRAPGSRRPSRFRARRMAR